MHLGCRAHSGRCQLPSTFTGELGANPCGKFFVAERFSQTEGCPAKGREGGRGFAAMVCAPKSFARLRGYPCRGSSQGQMSHTMRVCGWMAPAVAGSTTAEP